MNTGSWSVHLVDSSGNSSLQLDQRADPRTLVEKDIESAGGESSDATSGWEKIIDTLGAWADDVTILDDEGIIPPSYPIVRKALSLSHTLLARGWVPPLRVVPNAEGGLVFEHGGEEQFETIEIDSDGDVEYVAYLKDKVVCKKQLDAFEIQ